MPARLEAILDDDTFWREARRELVTRARRLFRESFLIGAALAANERPRTDRPDTGVRALTRLLSLAARQRRPEQMLAGLIVTAKDRYPGVDDNLLPIPGPDGQTLLPFDADAITRATDELIGAYTDRWWEQIETTTRESLRGVLRRAAAEGLTIEQVMREIEPLFGAARAERIAVSEVTNLMGQGAQLTYERAGFGRWIWRTVRDARVDPICDALARESDPQFGGTPFPMARRFERAHVGCRCWPVPYGNPTVQTRLPELAPTGPAVSTAPSPPLSPYPSGPEMRQELLARFEGLEARLREAETRSRSLGQALRADPFRDENRALLERWDAARQEVVELRETLVAEAREQILLPLDEAAQIEVAFPPRMPPATIARWQEGIDEWRRLVGRGTVVDGRTIHVRRLAHRARAYFTREFVAGRQRDIIALAPDADIDTIVHELGHWLESSSFDTQRARRAFYIRRTADSPLRPLRQITGQRGYAPDEVARPDEFISPYIGKDYGGVDGPDSEVISMGLQLLRANAVDFARRDPDMFDFIWDLLRDGRLAAEGAELRAGLGLPP